MAVTGDEWADVAVLFSGQEMQIYHVARDEEFIDALIAVERRFWEDHVLADTPPTPETSEEASAMWPRAGAGVVRGNRIALEVAGRLYEIKEQIKHYKAEQDRLELELKKQMEDIGDTLMVDGQKIATWKTQTSRRFDGKAFGADHPELYEEYKRESESRVFRLSYKPGKE